MDVESPETRAEDSHVSGTSACGNELPEEIRALVKSELLPGERLLWAGRPVRPPTGYRVSLSGPLYWMIVLWSLSAVCVAYATGRIGGRQNEIDAPLAAILGTIAGVCGLVSALVLGESLRQLWTQGRLNRGRMFALTNRRAIIWQPRSGSRAVEVYTHPARSLESLHRIEHADGTGDVLFDGRFANHQATGFLGIGEVRRVEGLARAVLVDPEYHRRRRLDASAANGDLDD